MQVVNPRHHIPPGQLATNPKTPLQAMLDDNVNLYKGVPLQEAQSISLYELYILPI